MRRVALVALACAGVAVGILAERQAFDWRDLSGWLPDLLAGWTLIGLGVLLLALRRPPGAAALLLLAGFTWFAFNFETTGPDELGRLAGEAAYLHRAPLFALALSLPSGWPRTRLAVAAVVVAWASVLVTPVWDNDWTALLLVGYFVVTATVIRAHAVGRRSRTIASRGLAAVTVLGAVIAADALGSIAGAPQGFTEATVLGYALAVGAAGILLASGAMLAAPASLAERAVALEGTGRTLRDALRDLLGDPRLEVGFATGPGPPVDDLGRPLAEPADGLVATPVTVSGRRMAVVLHEPATLDDAATRAAVFAAVGLAAERARLRSEVGRQVEAVEASGRRLLLAEDAERERLADRLERGPGADLAAAAQLVQEARSVPRSDEPLTVALDRASEQLQLVRPELDLHAHGLGGIGGDELVSELQRLAVRLPLVVELELSDLSTSSEIASALWFVCSESLTNVAKHAEAHRVQVVLSAENGAVFLSVKDDGRGGADPGGSGLRGLADRMEVLGGRLLVEAPPEGGTRVVAELPL